MKLIGWKERQRRMRAAHQEGWEKAGLTPDDPGLRERYASIHRAPIRLLACPLIKDVNHGGLLRLADAFRLEEVVFSPEQDMAVDFSGNRGTRSYQPFRWLPVEESIAEARQEGYTVAAVTLSSRSVAVQHASWTFPLALVMGAENEGVPQEVEDLCDLSLAIPLFGMVTSLNVVTAAAIVVHEAIGALRSQQDFKPVRRASQALLDQRG